MSRVLTLGISLLSLVVILGCGERETPPEEPQPEEERLALPEEAAEPRLPVALFPQDPGKSGVIGPVEVEDPAVVFGPESGSVSPLPAALVARESFRAVVDQGGALAFYGEESSEEARWRREAALPLLVLQEERLVTATEQGLIALGLEAGEVLWRVALEEPPGQLRSTEDLLVATSGRSVIWLSGESGRVIARRRLSAEARELLVAGRRVYVGTEAGLEAYDQERELVWRYEAPGFLRATLRGGVILLETSGGLLALGTGEGEALWEDPGRLLPFRPLLFADTVILGREEGVLEAYAAADGRLRWSGGVSPGIVDRPRFWQGRIWLPGSRGRLLAISPAGELLGSLMSGGEEVAFLYGNGERLGMVDHFGGYLELTPGGGELELSLESAGGAPFNLPALKVGEGPLLLELRQEAVGLDIEQAASGIYLFRLPLQERTEAVIDLIGEDGSVVGSNLDKIELAQTLRIRLEEEEAYRLEVRPAREELAGELTSVSLQLLREER